MGKLCAVTSCLFVTVAAVTAQTGKNTAQPQMERLLPQWLTGIIAVSAFLFVVFVTFLVKKAWCEDPDRPRKKVEASERQNDVAMTTRNTYATSLDMDRRKSSVTSDGNTYETTLDMVRRKSSVTSDGNTYETTLDMVRSKDGRNAFNNPAVDTSDDKVSSL
ncbi:PDZK1-interacting protein 1 isoform X2 [Larimichthys crocea]|uniref:PDZK1-interacting protein 1 isoform X2 n=1 Tax=Larimichthys crocea TaxID=215358 RepID=UPI000901A404|nr:small integral membrane protein 24-like isoform X2 [Larimichthys crocea]